MIPNLRAVSINLIPWFVRIITFVVALSILCATPSLSRGQQTSGAPATRRAAALPTGYFSEVLVLPMADAKNPASARMVAEDSTHAFGYGGISWTGTSIAVAYSDAKGGPVQRVLIPAAHSANRSAPEVVPWVCTEDATAFAVSGHGVTFDWKGRNKGISQLALRDLGSSTPPCAPDGVPALYALNLELVVAIAPASAPAGPPRQTRAALCSDGERIAYFFVAGDQPAKLFIGNVNKGAATAAPAPPPGVITARFRNSTLAWTPDGASILYIVRSADGENLWRQPVPRGKTVATAPAVQLTNFQHLLIESFAVSPDGKSLVLAVATVQPPHASGKALP
jgi:hypothetical protein